MPAGPFWEAEPEHQSYVERYPNGYTCHFVRPDWVLPRQTQTAASQIGCPCPGKLSEPRLPLRRNRIAVRSESGRRRARLDTGEPAGELSAQLVMRGQPEGLR